MKKRAIALLAVLCLLPALAGCGGEPSGKTDAPQDGAGSAGVEVELTEPITISFWHGIVQEDMQKTLAEIVDKFNNGIGKEMGITVESFAQGEMPDLENAVTAAIKAGKGKGVYTYAIGVSPLDCMGCGVCVEACLAKEKAIKMVPQESEAAQAKVWDYLVKTAPKADMQDNTVKGSQFKQPYLEFSGSCAGCAETSYARLVTQLFGDRMYISNATGCSSIWGGSAPSTPYTKDKNGRGPAWANSLFEDNAEFGLGMHTGVEKLRDGIQKTMEEAIAGCEKCSDELKQTMKEWIAARGSAAGSAEVTARLLPQLEACGRDYCKRILEARDWLVKKSQWIIGGDGWGYDIGFGGLDEVLASGENINVLVLDTEGYSNTGGEMSKATELSSVSGFTLDGKPTPRKDLGRMMMQYDYVYMAQVCLGADMEQTIRALREAEAYDGPSIVIALCPCISWGIKGGMSTNLRVAREGVEAGYWPLFRFNPQRAAAGADPLTVDYQAPDGHLDDFLNRQDRFTSLLARDPAHARTLHSELSKDLAREYTELEREVKVYEPESN